MFQNWPWIDVQQKAYSRRTKTLNRLSLSLSLSLSLDSPLGDLTLEKVKDSLWRE